MSLITRISRALKSDSGIALPTVIGISLAMLIMVAGSMTVVTGGLKKSNTDEDSSGALAAAYAGVEEYQSRLANDSTYQKYGNPASSFTSGSGSTVTLPTGANANLAFGVGTSGTWASVPVSTGDTVTAFYRYEIDNHDYQNKGVLHLRATGRVGNVTESVVVDLKQQGFIDYLYFTDYETLDPDYFGGTAAVIDPDTGKSVCEVHVWEDGGRPTYCTEIQFGSGDTFGGPVRSNDRLVICTATFNGPVLSASTTNPIYKKPSGCTPTFNAGAPTKLATIDMPPTNTQLKRETRNDLASDVPRPGCLYTGPTSITYSIVGGVPKMTILSPWTKYTNVAATKAGASNPAQCGTPGNVTNGLGSPTGAVLDVLNLNLVFVQSVPAAGADDANAPTSSTYTPPNVACTAASGSGNTATPAGWYYRTSTTTYQARYPMAGETEPYGDGITSHYGCKAGDVYIKGTLSGQTTVAAENYIYVTGDLLYKDKATDMLGLVGNNAIFVWNPVKYNSSSSFTNLTGMDNREVDAALLSVAHTFQVQNYLYGDRGTLTVFGAIAQKFRGTVSQGSNGFVKNYLYDDRFKNTAPPKFLTPVSTTYGVTQFASVPAAFKADGSNG